MAYLMIGAGVLVELQRQGFIVYEPRPADDVDLAASAGLIGAHRIAPEGLVAPTITVYAGRTDVARIEADPSQRVVARWSNLPDDVVDVWRDESARLTDVEKQMILSGDVELEAARPLEDQPLAAWRHVELHWNPVVDVEAKPPGGP